MQCDHRYLIMNTNTSNVRTVLLILFSAIALGACSSGSGAGHATDAGSDAGGHGGTLDGGGGSAGLSPFDGSADSAASDGPDGAVDGAADGKDASSDQSPDGGVVAMVTIPATANLWGAGHAVPPDPSGAGAGVLPTLVALPSGTGRTMTVTNVSGSVDFDGAGTDLTAYGADGFMVTGLPPQTEPTGSLGGIAGLMGPPCTANCMGALFFLAGVFVDASEPAEPAPSAYAVNPTAATITGIGLRQTFFVGDGLDGPTAGTGAVQVFHIPDGATRLFLGFFDAAGPGGLAGSYSDNVGQLAATVTITN
jgi:hypothetical protein